MTDNELVTKENFGKYEQQVCQMEFQRKKKLAERKIASVTGGIVFLITALSATYGLLFEPTDSVMFSQLRSLGDIWNELCASVLPEDYSMAYGIIFSMLAVAIISFAAHLLTALIVGLACPRGAAATLEGNDTQRAEELADRFAQAAADLPPRNRSVDIFVLAAAVAILLIPSMPDILSDITGVFGVFILILLVIFFLIVYAIPYFAYSVLCSLLYSINREPQLEKALNAYVDLCKDQELAKEERRCIEKAEQDRQRGDELYRQATSGGKMDKSLIQQAADLGCRPACLHLGRHLMEEWATGSYTKEEKADIAERAKGYFYTASQEEGSAEAKAEGTFGYLMFQSITESGSASKWKKILSQLRSIRASGLLPEHYNETCAMLIDNVVDMVDNAVEKEASHASHQHKPVLKRHYCKFLNAGVCGRRSTADYTIYCDHVPDPLNCWTATTEGGISFEFE